MFLLIVAKVCTRAKILNKGMARQRRNLVTELMPFADDNFASEDLHIDFSSAGLYLCGLQTVVSVVACSITSVASCWLLPASAVSAVRTLSITSVVAFACVRKPLRVGRVRGVTVIFNALRPCLVIYILSLTLQQLIHTCVTDHTQRGAWRAWFFSLMVMLMIGSAFARAYRPKAESDLPFLIASFALFVIAMLPPPAEPLAGPLCQAATLFSAAERVLRALLFGVLYVLHVYAAAPSGNSIHEITVCTARSGAAAIWILGANIFLLILAPAQAFLALWARFGHENHTQIAPPINNYTPVDARSDVSCGSDCELATVGAMGNIGALGSGIGNINNINGTCSSFESTPLNKVNDTHPDENSASALPYRNGTPSVFSMPLAPPGTTRPTALSSEQMAQIAATL